MSVKPPLKYIGYVILVYGAQLTKALISPNLLKLNDLHNNLNTI